MLFDHQDLVMDMKGYGQLSRNSAVNPRFAPDAGPDPGLGGCCFTVSENARNKPTQKKAQLRQVLVADQPLRATGRWMEQGFLEQGRQDLWQQQGRLEKGNRQEKGKTFKATVSSKATLKKGNFCGDGQTMVAVSPNGRKLKPTVSDVSADSAAS